MLITAVSDILERGHTLTSVCVCFLEISASVQHSITYMLEGEMSDSCVIYACVWVGVCVSVCVCGVNRTIFHSQRMLTVPPGLSLSLYQGHPMTPTDLSHFMPPLL